MVHSDFDDSDDPSVVDNETEEPALDSILSAVDLTWKIPPVDPRGHRKEYQEAILKAEEQITALQTAVKKLLLSNKNLRDELAKDQASNGKSRNPDSAYHPEFQKHCRNIRTEAKKFGLAYEMFISSDVFPNEHIPADKRIDPIDPMRYSNPGISKLAITGELYESLPPVLHPIMIAFPAEFNDVFSATLNENRRQLIKRVSEVVPTVYPRLWEIKKLSSVQRKAHQAELRSAIFAPNETRVKYAPLLFPNRAHTALNKIFMATELPMLLRAILFAPSSLTEMKAPSRQTYGSLWKMTEVTPGSIAFVAVVAIYLFSGDADFRSLGVQSRIPYNTLFDRYKKILIGRLAQGRAEIFKWYNMRVFQGMTKGNPNEEADGISDVDDAICAGGSDTEDHTSDAVNELSNLTNGLQLAANPNDLSVPINESQIAPADEPTNEQTSSINEPVNPINEPQVNNVENVGYQENSNADVEPPMQNELPLVGTVQPSQNRSRKAKTAQPQAPRRSKRKAKDNN